MNESPSTDPVQPESCQPDTPPEPFAIDCDERANWLVRKIVELRAYRERVDAWAAAEKTRSVHDEQHLMFRFGGQLRAWAAARIAEFQGRRKSVNLPAGTVGYRTSPSRLVVVDDAKVIEWAKRNCPDAVEAIERLSRSLVITYFEQTGEVPDAGAHVEPEAEEFYMR